MFKIKRNHTKAVSALLGLLTAALLCTAAACSQEPSYEDRETFPKETYAAVEGTEMVFRDGLNLADYPVDSDAARWLDGCDSPDRNDQFDAYTLRYESAAEGHTTFTYLIYYPHGADGMTATPELLQSGSGYVINLHYAPGDGVGDYSLVYLSVTLPVREAPRLRLLREEGALGVMSTVSETAISPVE